MALTSSAQLEAQQRRHARNIEAAALHARQGKAVAWVTRERRGVRAVLEALERELQGDVAAVRRVNGLEQLRTSSGGSIIFTCHADEVHQLRGRAIDHRYGGG